MPCPVALVLLLAFRGEGFDCLYCCASLHPPIFHLFDYSERHSGQFFLVAAALVLAAFERLSDLCDGFLRGDLALFRLVDDVAEFLYEFHFLSMGLCELYGIDCLGQLHDGRGVPCGVPQELFEPGLLQAQSDTQHKVGVGDSGNALGARLE